MTRNIEAQAVNGRGLRRPSTPPENLLPVSTPGVSGDGVLAVPGPDALTPAAPEWITGRVTTFLMHFYVEDLPENVQGELVADWVRALDGLSAWAIGRACDQWLARSTRKPKPAHIRTLAVEAAAPYADQERAKSEAALGGIKGRLSRVLDPVAVETWIKPLVITEGPQGVVLWAPTVVHRDWIEQRLGPEISRALGGRRVIYQVDETVPRRRAMTRQEVADEKKRQAKHVGWC